MSSKILDNLNELKGALENMNDGHLLDSRMMMLDMVEECLQEIESEQVVLGT